MSNLAPWGTRPPEEANLFNPAFCGALLFEFVKTYQKEKPGGVALPLLPIAFAIVLHLPTRERLPNTTLTSLYEWIQRNNDCLIGFPSRTKTIVPIVNESLLFSVNQNVLKFDSGYQIVLSARKASFTPKFFSQATNEIREIVNKTRFIARWFAKSGSESSILSSLGVKP